MGKETTVAGWWGLWSGMARFAQYAGAIPGGYEPAAKGDDAGKECKQATMPLLERITSTTLKNLASDENAGAWLWARVAVAERLALGQSQSPINPRKDQMKSSIFCGITLEEKHPVPHNQWVPLSRLRMERSLITQDEGDGGSEVPGQAAALWEACENRLQALARSPLGQSIDLNGWIRRMLLLLQEYAWCVPAAGNEGCAGVSLFDHTRMSAALASSLHGIDGGVLKALAAGEKQDALVAGLIGVEISGIQDFIYTIAGKKALAALRGRSLYLQLLTDALGEFILRELDLPLTNLIYAGGGHCYILGPVDALRKLEAIQRQIAMIVLRHHGGDLYVALSGVPLRADDFLAGGLSLRWEELSRDLRRTKSRRFSELGDDIYTHLFDRQDEKGDDELTCKVCYKEHPQTRERTVEDTDTAICPPCWSYRSWGDRLRSARYLSLRKIELRNAQLGLPAGALEDVLAELGLEAKLWDHVPRALQEEEMLYALDDQAQLDLPETMRMSAGRRYLVNVTPVLKREGGGEVTADMEDLAKRSKGIDRIGVLRMDVDNLGKMFSQGLGVDASLAAIAGLSFAVSLFFEGWVEVVARQYNEKAGGPYIYSIYSGGDDLFFVGSWDQVVQLAKDINTDFHTYVCKYPALHLSAGIVLVEEKYPMYLAAGESGEAEKAAKNIPGKDAVTFLGRTMKWSEFQEVLCWSEKLIGLTQAGIRNSLLQHLIRLQLQHDAEAFKRAQEGRDKNCEGQLQTYFGPWIPRTFYMISRMAEGRHLSSESKKGLEEIKTLLSSDKFSNISWIGLSARMTALRLRQ